MTRLYLTRHGETQWNLIGKVQGSLNSDLTEKGILQATKLGKYLANTNIDIIYSSSSNRAFNTAKAITGDRKIEIIKSDKLKEMNLGIWEGKSFEYIEKEYSEMFDTFWNRPHLVKEFPGETFNDFTKRVVGAVLEIIDDNKDKDILIVAHALVLKVAMSFFENRPLERLFEDHHMYSTCINEVEIDDKNYKIVRYNETPHYDMEVS